jgi:peptidoglycan hydrolase CwlO-like protein
VAWAGDVPFGLVVTFGGRRGGLARRRAGIRAAAVMLWLVAGFAGAAAAQAPAEEQYGVGNDEIPALEARAEEQEASLEARIGEISAVGAELEETQSRVDGARARAGDLGAQTRSLERELASRRETFEAAKAGYEEQARAAYKGGDLEGLSSLLGGLLGSKDGFASVADPRLAEILLEGRESLEAYRESEITLRNTSRQISEKKRDYEAALQEEKAQTGELRQRREELEEAIARISSRKAQTAIRLNELRAAERARILEQKAATAAGPGQRAYELGIARDDIVSRAVEPISKKAYRKLYREAAREYGFGEDWYILAAVGKVESDHGANMGPSTAGAMGPMQFLPSTWETSGVDGNGDGVANIMDPEDAIPASAGYLKSGGAPQDWYAALFSYNHADWYVIKVLGVAEGYRRLLGDETVGPYI